MSDAITKFRILLQLVSGTYREWKKEVWARDLDGVYCCNGQECGCYGASVREMWFRPKEQP